MKANGATAVPCRIIIVFIVVIIVILSVLPSPTVALIPTAMRRITSVIAVPRRLASRQTFQPLTVHLSNNHESPTPPPIYAAMAAPVASIKGVGAKTAECLHALGLHRVSDVLFYFPTGVIDRTRRVVLSQATLGEVVTATLTVVAARKAFNPGMPHTFVCKVIITCPLTHICLLSDIHGVVCRTPRAPPWR